MYEELKSLEPFSLSMHVDNVYKVDTLSILLVKYMTLSKEEWAYLAGIVDGEGSISFRRRKGKNCIILEPKVSITTTSLELVNWIKNKLPNIRCRIEKDHRNPRWKPRHELYYQKHSGVYSFLKGIYPYLIIKKKHAELMLEFIEIRKNAKWGNRWHGTGYSSREFEIEREIRKLNRKGRHDDTL